MGDPRKTRKQFKRPLMIWNTASIAREKVLKETFGLKNKREIWKTETNLRKKRHSARSLLALPLEERLKREKELIGSLSRMGILSENAGLDDVLTLTIESFLERRLQTIVWRKGLANTATQARQFVTHRHIAIGGKRVTAPSYMVTTKDEGKIDYYAGKKMILTPIVKEAKKNEKKKTIKEEFEEAKPAEAPTKNAVDIMKAIKNAREKSGSKEEKGGKEKEKTAAEPTKEKKAAKEEPKKEKKAAKEEPKKEEKAAKGKKEVKK